MPNAGELFSDAGLVPDMKVLASGSKVLSFTKPLPEAKATSGAAAVQL